MHEPWISATIQNIWMDINDLYQTLSTISAFLCSFIEHKQILTLTKHRKIIADQLRRQIEYQRHLAGRHPLLLRQQPMGNLQITRPNHCWLHTFLYQSKLDSIKSSDTTGVNPVQRVEKTKPELRMAFTQVLLTSTYFSLRRNRLIETLIELSLMILPFHTCDNNTPLLISIFS